ncbi:MAG: nucleotide-binding protein [Candidatus Dormibacteria bacterium]
MKIAVIGKGGSGKTTVSGVLARSLARAGWEVVAIDCDSNPNLGISLGLGIEATESLAGIRQALDEGSEEHAATAEEVLERFGTTGPDRVRVAVVTRIDKPTSGCPCCGLSPEQLLGELESGRRALIADMEAGLGTLTRMGEASLDVAVLVTEPTPKAIEVVRRAVEVLAERRVAARIVVLANKTRQTSDLESVRQALGALPSLAGVEVIPIPDDPQILAADVAGISPVDMGPASPGVEALLRVAELLAA